jgi:hypothetical protein
MALLRWQALQTQARLTASRPLPAQMDRLIPKPVWRFCRMTRTNGHFHVSDWPGFGSKGASVKRF